MLDYAPLVLAAACGIFALGGFTKGVLGVGLPMVVLPLLSIFLPIPEVVAVMYLPIFVSNLYQALMGGYLLKTLKRFWPLLLVLVLFVWVGTFSLARLDPSVVSVLLGGVVVILAVLSLTNPTFTVPPRWDRPLGLLAGASGGFFGGMALIGGPAVIMYFVALKLKKEEFIGSISLVYLLTLLPAGASLVTFGVLETRHVLPGLAAMVPTFAGMALGQWIRGKVDQERFRKLLLGMMVVIGLNLVRKGLF